MSENLEFETVLPLSNVDSVLESTFSTFRSYQTGLGTTRDKTQSYEINDSIKRLSQYECNALFRTSRMCRKAVSLYPQDAGKGWCTFVSANTDFKSDDLQIFFDNLRTGSLRRAFVDASIEARLHGDAYILLGVDDGQQWDQPLNENKIKSFDWIEILSWNECTADFSGNYRNPEFFWVTLTDKRLPENNNFSMRVHKSRLLRFTGDRLYGQALIDNAGRNDSILQISYNSFVQHNIGVMAAAGMLSDYSVFKYKLKNLAKMIQAGQQDAILQRFLTMQMGMSTVKGLIMDSDNEDADFMNQTYTGVKDILNSLTDQLVSSFDIPRYKILESSDDKYAEAKSQTMRFEWAGLVSSWQNENWLEPLLRCVRIAFLAKNGPTKGNLPESYDIEFTNTFQLSPLEEAELELSVANRNKINIDSGIYKKYEARMSTYGGEKFSHIVNLEEDVSKALEKEMLEKDEPEPVVASVDSQAIKDYNKKEDSKVQKIILWRGLSIGLEVLDGGERFGKKLKGVSYGHIRNHRGEDGEALDCYISSKIITGEYNGQLIARVSQLTLENEFDEYKYFIGFTVEEAKKKYLELMPIWMLGGVKKVTLKDITRFRKDSDIAVEGETLTDEEYEKLSEITQRNVLEILGEITSGG